MRFHPVIRFQLAMCFFTVTVGAAFAYAARSVEDVSELLRVVKSKVEPNAVCLAWKKLGRVAEQGNIPDLLFVLGLPESDSEIEQASQAVAMSALLELAKRDGFAEPFVESFLALKRGASPLAKERMIAILKVLDTGGSRNLLISFFSDPDAIVVRCAINALDHIEPALVKAALLSLLSLNNDIAIRKDVILALGRLKCDDALSKLIEQLNSKNAGIKGNAQWALRNITEKTFANAGDANLWLEAEEKNCEERFKTFADQLKNGSPDWWR